ncbi:hypothetical protein IPdc08_01545 [archaeon]|nr:hypothetical protein IPdc08_01545 [archaeon]
MPARILEVAIFTMVTIFIVMFLFTSGLMSVPLMKETILKNGMQAKQLYLTLDSLPATYPSLPPSTTPISLVRNYYTTGNATYLKLAKKDITLYSNKLFKKDKREVWRVYTLDGALNVESSNFSKAKIEGSVSANILNKTKIVTVVGSFS